jgi:hypothetical protein
MISFIVPSIRVEKLPKTYASIDYSGVWEMIVIGPYKPPPMPDNVRWVEDWGHLVRARQLGLIDAQGEYVTWMVDDGVYVPGALDRAFYMIDANTIVSMMVEEGGGGPDSLNPEAYRAGMHDDCKLPGVPRDTLLILFGICPRDKLLAVGGWDCRFEGMGLADVDLSIRLRQIGVHEKLAPFHCVSCEWMAGTSGDHAPVHHAHFENDLPLFRSIYGKREVKLDNWKNVPAKWGRRFGG